MFSDNWNKEVYQEIEIFDIEYDVFLAILNYIYFDILFLSEKVTIQFLMNVLEQANYYEIQRLQQVNIFAVLFLLIYQDSYI